MAVKTKAQLQAYITANILTGGSQTSASSLRTLGNDILDSLLIPSEVQAWTLRPNAAMDMVLGGLSAAHATIYLLPHGVATAADNYALSSDGTDTHLNAPHVAGQLKLRIDDEDHLLIKSVDGRPITLSAWIDNEGTHAAMYFADTPAANNQAIGGDDASTTINAFTDLVGSIQNDPIWRAISTQLSITKKVAIHDDLDYVPDEMLEVKGNLKLLEAGNRITIQGGVGAFIGTAVLVNGHISIANTSITNASSRIFLSRVTGSNSLIPTYTITDGIGFDIDTNDSGDNGSFVYIIFDEGT